MARQKTQKRDANAAQRVILAIQLRTERASYSEIARQCGYADAAVAYNAIQRELQRVMVEGVEELRREEAASLDRLEAACWERFNDPTYAKSKMFAADRILAIKERRAKLFGLDMKADTIEGQLVIEEVPAGYLTGPAPTIVPPAGDSSAEG